MCGLVLFIVSAGLAVMGFRKFRHSRRCRRQQYQHCQCCQQQNQYQQQYPHPYSPNGQQPTFEQGPPLPRRPDTKDVRDVKTPSKDQDGGAVTRYDQGVQEVPPPYYMKE
ncbi:hypothetical protein SBRCBS47491_006980 [Sporothrix bragantina]|uniref:Secreted protein n=1 Tax=Sporothrix bragantina TaxID=671064 RepID=A0ABP0C9R0_9PEZI